MGIPLRGRMTTCTDQTYDASNATSCTDLPHCKNPAGGSGKCECADTFVDVSNVCKCAADNGVFKGKCISCTAANNQKIDNDNCVCTDDTFE